MTPLCSSCGRPLRRGEQDNGLCDDCDASALDESVEELRQLEAAHDRMARFALKQRAEARENLARAIGKDVEELFPRRSQRSPRQQAWVDATSALRKLETRYRVAEALVKRLAELDEEPSVVDVAALVVDARRFVNGEQVAA